MYIHKLQHIIPLTLHWWPPHFIHLLVFQLSFAWAIFFGYQYKLCVNLTTVYLQAHLISLNLIVFQISKILPCLTTKEIPLIHPLATIKPKSQVIFWIIIVDWIWNARPIQNLRLENWASLKLSIKFWFSMPSARQSHRRTT